MNFILSTPSKDLKASATRREAAFLRSFERPAGNRLCLGILLLLTSLLANAQPIPPDITGLPPRYVFTVYTPVSTAEAIVWSSETTDLTTHRLVDRTDTSEVRLRPAQHRVLRTYVDLGADAGAVKVNEEQGAPAVQEHLSYPDLLTPEQRQLTESYLAIKHGLTLDQHQPTNYLAPAADGNSYPVWTATADRVFRHRITGLGFDERSYLKRLSASSALAPKLLNLSWRESPASTAYLLLADDNLPTARETNIAPDGTQHLQRRWRVESSGATLPTTLAFATSNLFARAQPGETWALLLRQGDTETLIPATRADNRQVLFRDLDFGQDTIVYFQLALRCNGCHREVSLPHSDFVASAELSPNPVQRNQPVQLRVALKEASALSITGYDAAGRLVFQHPTLPTSSHHLAELTFPAPGPYTLHLRPRRKSRQSPQHSLRIIVH